MAYIGKEPIVGNFQVCDAISVVNGQAAYTMQVSSTNVVPESANHMLVSLNGILQKPNSSFTVSGSTITFASALATGDVIDFIMLLGNVLDLGVPSDATVTDAKANFVSTSSAAGLQIKGDGTTDGTLQLNCSQNSHGIKLKSPSHASAQSYTLTFPTTSPATDKFLKTDSSGNLSFADAGGSNTPSFFAVSTSSEDGTAVSNDTLTKMTFSTEVFDTDNCYDNSTNYRFTPNVAGKYFVFTKAMADNLVANATTKLEFYKNGSQMDDNYRMRIKNGSSPVGDVENTLILSAIIDMNGTSDYIEVYGTHNIGGNSSGLFDKHFGAYKIIT